MILNRIADRDGDLLTRRTFPGVTIFGRKNLVGQFELYIKDRTRVAEELLDATSFFGFFQIDPSRRISRISANWQIGQTVDYANRRVGDGGDVALEATIKPTDHLELGLRGERQWLDVSTKSGRSGRLFTAQIERLKATYNFTARAFLRFIAEYYSVDRDPSLYDFEVPAAGGSFAASALFSYKLSWQTVFFLGFGDNHALDPAKNLLRTDRQFFLKVSYAFQK